MGEQENKEINEKVMRLINEGKHNTALGLQSATALPYRLVDNCLKRLKCAHQIVFDKKLGIWKKYVPVNREEEKYIHMPTSKIVTGSELDTIQKAEQEEYEAAVKLKNEEIEEKGKEEEQRNTQYHIGVDLSKEEDHPDLCCCAKCVAENSFTVNELPNGLKELPPESINDPVKEAMDNLEPNEILMIQKKPLLGNSLPTVVEVGEVEQVNQVIAELVPVPKENLSQPDSIEETLKVEEPVQKIIEGGIFDNVNEELPTIAEVEEAEKNPQTEIMD